MFSLIISIIAIALAAVLLLTSAFYGGDALTEGTVKAEAASLANEAQQISAGYDLYKVENAGAVPSAVDGAADSDTLVGQGYLKQAPATAWEIVGGVLSTSDVAYDPATGVGVSDEVCAQVSENAVKLQNGLTCADSATGNNVVSFTL